MSELLCRNSIVFRIAGILATLVYGIALAQPYPTAIPTNPPTMKSTTRT